MNMTNQTKSWIGAGLLALLTLPAAAQVSVQGALAPGVYGRIDIGNAPPPPLIYAQPVIIQRGPNYLNQPVYLRVPPGHEKKWSKHCSKYNACGQPVYFVRDGYQDNRRGYDGRRDYDDNYYKKDKKDKKDKHHGKGRGHDD